MTEINWLPVRTVSSGTHRATLINVQLTLGVRSGKPVIVWTFRLDGGQLIQLTTSNKGESARKGYECAKALGLSRRFAPEEAVGRTCRVVVDSSGPYDDVTKVLPA